MARLFRRDPTTPEGKFPIVLRRDGSPVRQRNFVMFLKDPGCAPALRAYAAHHAALGSAEDFVEDIRDLAHEAHLAALEDAAQAGGPTSDPDAPPHRTDDDLVIAWARSIGNPGS